MGTTNKNVGLHEFYEEKARSSEILWKIWGSSEPVLLTDLYTTIDAEEQEIQRELMYFINSSLILPTQEENDIAFIFNPYIEWAIAVQELIRTNTKDELEFKLREAKAELEMYEELNKADTAETYYEENPEDIEDFAQWITAEYELKWIEDAITVYDLLTERFQEELSVDTTGILSKEDAEKYLVKEWGNTTS